MESGHNKSDKYFILRSSVMEGMVKEESRQGSIYKIQEKQYIIMDSIEPSQRSDQTFFQYIKCLYGMSCITF